MKWKRSCGSAGGQRGNGSMLGEATLDVLGTFLGEAIRVPIQFAALHLAGVFRGAAPVRRCRGTKPRRRALFRRGAAREACVLAPTQLGHTVATHRAKEGPARARGGGRPTLLRQSGARTGDALSALGQQR